MNMCYLDGGLMIMVAMMIMSDEVIRWTSRKNRLSSLMMRWSADLRRGGGI